MPAESETLKASREVLQALDGALIWEDAAVEEIDRLSCGIPERVSFAGKLVVEGANAAQYPVVTGSVCHGFSHALQETLNYNFLETLLFGISSEGLRILGEIAHGEEVFQIVQMARHLKVSHSGLENWIKRLSQRGVVERTGRGFARLMPVGMRDYLNGSRAEFLSKVGSD